LFMGGNHNRGWGGCMITIPNRRPWSFLFAVSARSKKEAQYKVILDESLLCETSTIYANHKYTNRRN
jgi:hypothetical protein